MIRVWEKKHQLAGYDVMKGKWVYIVVLLLVPVVAIGGLFFIPGPAGEPLMNMQRLKQSFHRDWFLIRKAKQMGEEAREKAGAISKKAREHLTSKETETFDPSFDPPPETLFKWRDKEGNLHFSNLLPPDIEEFEVVK